ncbi:hypothetical protein C0581_04720 [Candidatus Parcubacteria bacterium]|nr:MAG: hypothetical protein C0581_04720 [Candidatus Parcubacteria bacterium]
MVRMNAVTRTKSRSVICFFIGYPLIPGVEDAAVLKNADPDGEFLNIPPGDLSTLGHVIENSYCVEGEHHGFLRVFDVVDLFLRVVCLGQSHLYFHGVCGLVVGFGPGLCSQDRKCRPHFSGEVMAVSVHLTFIETDDLVKAVCEALCVTAGAFDLFPGLLDGLFPGDEACLSGAVRGLDLGGVGRQ